ncbi:hypothetical protein UM550_09325 [Staphylococcus aureus]|nr:hypothetical protein UM550_09325 [Staphylococcus aureus]
MEIMDVILMHDEAKQAIHEMLEKENKYEVRKQKLYENTIFRVCLVIT